MKNNTNVISEVITTDMVEMDLPTIRKGLFVTGFNLTSAIRPYSSNPIQTGFVDLDDCLGEINEGDFIALASQELNLANSFMVSLIRNVCVRKAVPVCCYSPALVAGSMLHYLLLASAGKTADQLLEDDTIEIDGAKLYIKDEPSFDLDDLEKFIEFMKNEFQVGLVVVNHFGYLKDGSCFYDSDAYRVMKILARKYRVAIILYHPNFDIDDHFKRLSYHRDPCESFCDGVIYIRSNKSNQQIADLHVAHSRRVTNKTIQLVYIENQYRLETLLKQDAER